MYDFALSLHRRLPAGGNLVWSPYSVASALGLLAAGARGETRDELAGVLGAGPGEPHLTDAATPPGAEIAVANTLWTRDGFPVASDYRRAVAGFPGAASRSTDFAADPEAARREINDDVAKTTRELIGELLPAGSVTGDTSALLVNALYLKAAWMKVFAKNATRPGPFEGAAGRSQVPMMRQTGHLPYAEADGWRMVTLPAEGRGVVADVLLGDGTAPTPKVLRRLYETAGSVKVELTLPRFRVEASASLTGPLADLGVRTAFTDDADLSGIGPEPTRIDGIEHKAVLDVDEDGFEGAAATAVIMVPAGMDMSRPVEFRVDRPFLLVVRHPDSGAVYFLARVADLPTRG